MSPIPRGSGLPPFLLASDIFSDHSSHTSRVDDAATVLREPIVILSSIITSTTVRTVALTSLPAVVAECATGNGVNEFLETLSFPRFFGSPSKDGLASPIQGSGTTMTTTERQEVAARTLT